MGPKLVDWVAALLAQSLGHTEYPGSDTRSLSQPLLNEGYLVLILKCIPELDKGLKKSRLGITYGREWEWKSGKAENFTW